MGRQRGTVTMKFMRVSPTAKVPSYGSQGAAGADLYLDSAKAVSIAPGETAVIHTGIAVAIPAGYVGLIFARSGLATKRGLAPANKVGVIDSDYRGELLVSLYNQSGTVQTLEPYERVAQLVIVPFLPVEYEEVETLDETARGQGGFGSTGRL